MPTHYFKACVVGACMGLVFFATACSRAEQEQHPTVEGQNFDGLAGIWGSRYTGANGRQYRNILELMRDGGYATYMQDATPDDRGSYSVDGKMLAFQSDVNPRLSQKLPFELNEDHLKIFVPTYPGASADTPVNWRRAQTTPSYETVNIAGTDIPVNLPNMVNSVLVARVLPWQDDALPVSLEFEKTPLGRSELKMLFFSPSVDKSMRLTVTKYAFKIRVIDGSRLPRTPLPAKFMDLPDIVGALQGNGFRGPLKRAQLRSYEKAGPVWMLSLSGAKGETYSAVTGERIKGDVTGYIAQYEADWAKNAEVWRKVYEQRTRCGVGRVRDMFGACNFAATSRDCRITGGTWMEAPERIYGGYCKKS